MDENEVQIKDELTQQETEQEHQNEGMLLPVRDLGLPKEKLLFKTHIHKCPHPDCGATFSRPFRLKTHLNVHTGERPYQCRFEGCTRAYANNANLQRHQQVTHNPLAVKPKYKCAVEDCSEEFCSTSSLRRHVERKHERKYPFNCEICKRGFMKQDQLKTHEFEHTSISPFRCDICDTGYLTPYDLRRHNRRHKKRTCEHCGLEFKDAALLRKHHGLEHKKSYTCGACGKLFLNKAMFTQHELIHLDRSERTVYSCPYSTCPRFYYAKRNVDYHVRVFHQGLKNKQKCHVCGKELSNRQKLKLHLELHAKMGINIIPPAHTEASMKPDEVDVKQETGEGDAMEVKSEMVSPGFSDEGSVCEQSEDDSTDIPEKCFAVPNENSLTDDSSQREFVSVSVKQEYLEVAGTSIPPLEEESSEQLQISAGVTASSPEEMAPVKSVLIKTECEDYEYEPC